MFGVADFEVLEVVDDGTELAIEAETTRRLVCCSSCGDESRPEGPAVESPCGTCRRGGDGAGAVAQARLALLGARLRGQHLDLGPRLADPRRVLTTRAAAVGPPAGWSPSRGTPASVAWGLAVS